MKYLVIAILALVLGGLIGRAIWMQKPQQPVDPVQVIVTQLKTHAVISHERQVAIWYRACPEVFGKTPTIFIAWPARISYQLELRDVQVTRSGTVIKVRTPAIHADEPAVPTDFMDYLSTKSIFTFANEEELVNREIGHRLFLSEETIKTHMRSLLAKLQARSRAHAVAVGLRRQLIS